VSAPDGSVPDGGVGDGSDSNASNPDGSDHDRSEPDDSEPDDGEPDDSARKDSARKDSARKDSARKDSARKDSARAHARVALVALTAGTASLDVTAFFRLGGVFASVMTSNLVFVGVAVVKTEAAFGARCAVAILSYIVGVGLGSVIAPPSGHESRLGTRPLSLLLTGELALLVAYTIWWMALDASPAGWTRLALLGLIALAMGSQSAATRQLGNPNAGTTYLTGTLTSVVSSLAGRRRPDAESVAVLIALLVGAGAGAALLDAAPITVPLLALVGVGTTVALSWHFRSTHPH
jgi:uncharacterized membrane protein YoaK (UPF0700 family)